MAKVEGSEFLCGQDILDLIDNKRGMITKEPVYVEKTWPDGSTTRRFECVILLSSGISKKWTMNKKTENNLAAAWGKDTLQWMNKDIDFESRIQNVVGVDRNVIYAKPVIIQTEQVK